MLRFTVKRKENKNLWKTEVFLKSTVVCVPDMDREVLETVPSNRTFPAVIVNEFKMILNVSN